MGKIKKIAPKVTGFKGKSDEEGKKVLLEAKAVGKIAKSPKEKSSHKKSHVLKLAKVKTSSGIRKSLTKKEKMKMKVQKLKEKIELTKAAFKEDKARKKREKRPIIGDLKPLLDSLPSLDELLTLRGSSSKTGISSIDRKIPKVPKNKKERKQFLINEKTEKMLDRFDHVQKIWKDPEYQKDPRKLIAEKIRQRREQQQNEMEN